ncbi:MAG TPA: right-handed parallel beta-helix repeat-containing protein, partial [Thermoanaerobaculia bacterium]|jgi:hypothetical protein
VNPCSRTAPCKTFAGAISKTAPGGEISVLDPGGYGALTINKSITINGNGTHASCLFSGTSGFTINSPGIIVNINDISFNGGAPNAPGVNGIRIIQAASVSVSNCDIFNFSSNGIVDERTTAGSTVVTNTRIHNSLQSGVNTTTVGIRVNPSAGSAQNTLTCDRCTIFGNRLGNSHGVFVTNGGRVTLTNTKVFNNTFGVAAAGPSGASEISIIDSDVSANSTGLRTTAGGTIRLSNVLVTANTTNGLEISGGAIQSFGNNKIIGNTGNNGAGLTAASNQ